MIMRRSLPLVEDAFPSLASTLALSIVFFITDNRKYDFDGFLCSFVFYYVIVDPTEKQNDFFLLKKTGRTKNDNDNDCCQHLFARPNDVSVSRGVIVNRY
jgi:hypothetical protein